MNSSEASRVAEFKDDHLLVTFFGFLWNVNGFKAIEGFKTPSRRFARYLMKISPLKVLNHSKQSLREISLRSITFNFFSYLLLNSLILLRYIRLNLFKDLKFKAKKAIRRQLFFS